MPELAHTLAGRGPGRLQHEQTYVPVLSPALTAEGHEASEDGNGRRALIAYSIHNGQGDPNWDVEQSQCLDTQAPPAIAFAWQQGDDSKYGRVDAVAYGFDHTQDPVSERDAVPTLNHDGQAVVYQCHGSNVGPLGTLRQGNGGLTGGVPFFAAPLTAGGHPNSTAPGRRREDDEHSIVVNGNSTPEVRVNEALALRHNDGSGNRQWVSSHGPMIRRLTPTECERLQGFLDGWTCLCGVVPYSTWTCRCPDSNRYAAAGNAVAVPPVDWLLERCAAVLREERIP